MHKVLRTLGYAVVGAACAVVLGKVALLATGLHCHCFWNDPVVALKTGALGGAFFSFIYQPNPFQRLD